jgi:hypothetical protein
MQEETPEKETTDILLGFPELETALRESGVDLADRKVAEAVLVTTKVLGQYVTQHTDQIAKKLDDIDPKLDRLIERFKETESSFAARVRTYQLATAAVGFIAAAITLVSGYDVFLRGTKVFVEWFHRLFTSSLFEPAYAATSLGANETTSSILPVIIYGIYALLAVGYIGSFFAMIFAPDKKVRSDAFEYLKQITALFIGVASGKLL